MNKLKIALVGQCGVGKSATTTRYVCDRFLVEYDPTIEDSYRKQVKYRDENFMLDILDTAGAEEYSSLQDLYYRLSDGFLFVFALDSASSFHNCQNIIEKIQRSRDQMLFPIVIVGNKCDTNSREVSFEEGKQYAEINNCTYVEISAKEGINVGRAFELIIKRIQFMKVAEKERVLKK